METKKRNVGQENLTSVTGRLLVQISPMLDKESTTTTAFVLFNGMYAEMVELRGYLQWPL